MKWPALGLVLVLGLMLVAAVWVAVWPGLAPSNPTAEARADDPAATRPAASSAPASRLSERAPADRHGDSLWTYDTSPIELLESLTDMGDPQAAGYRFPLTLNDAPAGWLNEESVKPLVAKVRSTVPCRGVVHLYSSRLDLGGSTVGREALFLIEGYLEGKYPPGLISTDVKMTAERAERLFPGAAAPPNAPAPGREP